MKEKTLSLSRALKSTKGKASVLIVVLLCAGLLAGFIRPGGGPGANGGPGESATSVRTITLEPGDLASMVSATGTVYSSKVTEVYSTLNYPVRTVNVSVGDKVNEGDVLCELDTASLEFDISQKQASISNSRKSAQQNLSTAQQDMTTYQSNVENDLDSNLLNARSAVTTAELDVQSAWNDMNVARRNLSDARKGEGAYEETGEATDYELRALKDTLYAKETALEKAEANLKKAEASLEAAKQSSTDTLASYQNKLKSAQINNNFSDQEIALQKLQNDLEKCVIISPVSGTITAVNAVEGSGGSGLLFVIQDTDNLKVISNIKEYDIDTVNVGDDVVIKADATGDKEFSGVLSKISPTSTVTAAGASSTSTDAEFESEVTVAAGAQGLRIGMNTRLSIITDERKNIFSVPYEAVGIDSDGNSCVYVMKTGEDGKAYYEKISVTTGLETNLYVEISSEALQDGMQVVRTASAVEAMNKEALK